MLTYVEPRRIFQSIDFRAAVSGPGPVDRMLEGSRVYCIASVWTQPLCVSGSPRALTGGDALPAASTAAKQLASATVHASATVVVCVCVRASIMSIHRVCAGEGGSLAYTQSLVSQGSSLRHSQLKYPEHEPFCPSSWALYL